MKKKTVWISLAAAAMTIGAAAGVYAEDLEVQEIHVGTTGIVRPFSYYNEDDNLTGHDVELIEKIFEKLPQYEIVWEIGEHDSIFSGLDSGRIQIGANNYGKNAEREEKYDFSEPYLYSTELVIAKKELELSGDLVTLDELAGYTYAGVAGVNHTAIVEDYNDANPEAQIDIQYVENNTQALLSDVDTGRFDFTILNAPLYYGFYQPEFQYDLNTAELDVPDTASYVYLLFAKGNDQLVEDVNAAYAELVADGTAKELSEKYFENNYVPE